MSDTALVTGATEGIGRATALALGRAGYRVGICSRTGAKVAATLAELRDQGVTAAGAAADVADPEQVRALVEQVGGALGEIDVLVNNAGVLIARPLHELTLEDWDATMATNLRGLYLTTRLVLPGMRARGTAPSSTSPASPAATDSSGEAPTARPSMPCWGSAAR